MTNVDLYNTYIAGADANDRRRFDSFLIGFLLNAVDEATAQDAIETAAAHINGGAS